MLPEQKKRLEFIHFNDVYEVSRGGRFYYELLAHGWKDKLRLFSGDFFFPSILGVTFLGQPQQKFMELLDIEYATIGNHEVDKGEALLMKLIAPLRTKWVMCNFKHKDGTNLGGAADFEVFERDGFKIGIFGVLDTFWIDASNPVDCFYIDYAEKIVEISALLHARGCDLIICLTHMANVSDEHALKLDSHVDLFLGGHEHVYYVRQDNQKLMLKSGSDYDMFSDVSLFFDTAPLPDACADGYAYKLSKKAEVKESKFAFSMKRGERFLNVRIGRVEVALEGPVYQPFYDYVHEQMRLLEEQTKIPALLFNSEINFKAIRRVENGVANFLVDVQRIELDTDISFTNAGAIRSCRLMQPGDVLTQLELMEFEPYHAPIKAMHIPGHALVTLLNRSYTALPGEHGRFLHVSGLSVSISVGKNPVVRPEDVLYEGRPIDLQRMFFISTPDFISGGRDGLSILGEFPKTRLNGDPSIFEMARRFFELSASEANRREFALFKQHLSDLTDGDLRAAFRAAKDRAEGVEYLSDLPKPPTPQSLALLSPACIRRLRHFRLADAIVESKKRFIFALSGKCEGRINQLCP